MKLYRQTPWRRCWVALPCSTELRFQMPRANDVQKHWVTICPELYSLSPTTACWIEFWCKSTLVIYVKKCLPGVEILVQSPAYTMDAREIPTNCQSCRCHSTQRSTQIHICIWIHSIIDLLFVCLSNTPNFPDLGPGSLFMRGVFLVPLYQLLMNTAW